MTEQWQQYLLARGATFRDGRVADFAVGSGATPAADFICDLSHTGVIRVSGADAAAFLHAQLTNDVQSLTDGAAQWNGWCTPKGRLLVSFLITREGNDYLLQLPRPLLAAIQKRLSMFVLRSKVVLQDVSDQQIRIGVGGKACEQLAAHLGVTLPAAMQSATTNQSTITRVDADRVVLSAPAEAAIAAWEALRSTATESGAARWDLASIRAGVVDIGPAVQDAFVPQMVNFDLVGGLSFKKGCYPGQEIVARTQYRGILKRRMVRVSLPLDAAVNSGDAIYSPMFGDQAAGQIALVAKVGEAHEALVVAQREAISAIGGNGLTLDSAHLQPLVQLPLPYEIPG